MFSEGDCRIGKFVYTVYAVVVGKGFNSSQIQSGGWRGVTPLRHAEATTAAGGSTALLVLAIVFMCAHLKISSMEMTAPIVRNAIIKMTLCNANRLPSKMGSNHSFLCSLTYLS